MAVGTQYGNRISLQRKSPLASSRFGHLPIQQSAVVKVLKHPEFAAHLEDIVGFGLVRTLFNTFRMYFFTTVDERQKQLNWSAAREWTIRELGNQFCANFLSGLSMVGMAGLVRKMGKPHIADQFASNDTLTLFQGILEKSQQPREFIHAVSRTVAGPHTEIHDPVHHLVAQTLHWMDHKSTLKTEGAFIQHLAQQLDPHQASVLIPQLQAFYEQVRQNPTVHYTVQNPGETAQQVTKKIKTADDFVEALRHTLKMPENQAFDSVFKPTEHAAVELAKLLKQKDFAIERTVGEQSLHLNLQNLLEDAHHFLQAVPKGEPWQQSAVKLLSKTQGLKRWLIPVALGIGMAGTMLIPYINKWVTEKVDNIDDYVGEMGLRDMKKVNQQEKKGWLSHAFPYVMDQWKKGKVGPLLTSLIPLPFAFGVFDNGALHNGQWSKAFNRPFKKGFLRRAYDMFQFRKGAPFMTGHQLLALCALVCTARVLTARDKIEMRERLVDSYGGWLVWAVGFGLLKKGLAKALDYFKEGSRLLNGAAMRPMEEIQHFMPKDLAAKTLKAASWLKWSSTLILIATVGILEPYIALKWTEYQVRKKQQGEAKNQASLPSAPFSPVKAPSALPLWALPEVAATTFQATRPAFTPFQAALPRPAYTGIQ